ncbi:MAG: carboxylating nicotinate-nucleotide diphosphorylase [Actinobacteria bacterium]|nr:carboxylating nicotinate-nucleotide diphosphorylase [Actinomycetota bacterium]
MRRSAMISASLTERLKAQGLDVVALTDLIKDALAEDKASEDKTTLATIDSAQTGTASLKSRQNGIVAGVNVAAAVFEIAGVTEIEFIKKCGERLAPGEKILAITGKTRAILSSERVALNLISHLSGIATTTKNWVERIAGTGAVIRDTRKTNPGLRELEKFAVRMGGGENHRINLADGALIKDNHIAAAGSITDAISNVRRQYPGLPVEVEVDSIAQLEEALKSSPEMILLDNMSIADTKKAVSLTRDSKTLLESSGGLTLESVRGYAECGVDYLAVGAITHSAPILDIGLDF